MSLTRSLKITVCLLAATLVVPLACNPADTQVILPDPPPGRPEPQPVPPLTAFLSANRSILIRDDANEGSAVLTARASRAASFTWTIDAPAGLRLETCVGPDTDCVPLPANGEDPHVGVESFLRLLGVLSDPGPVPAGVIVRVVANEGGATAEEEIELAVVRPEGELAVSISAASARIAPRGSVELTARVTGGAQFVADLGQVPEDCDANAANNESNPPDAEPAYCITWTLDESGMTLDGRGGGALDLSGLTTGDNGEEVSAADYDAPLGVGSVTFRVDVTDRRGNRATATLAITVNSERELDIADGSAASIEVAPGRSVPVSATAAGGEAPYGITFELLGEDPLGALGSSGCQDLTEEDVCEVLFEAPSDRVGAVQIRVTIVDAVGATSSTIIPLSVAAPEPLTVEAAAPGATLPNSTVEVKADVSGGTPPYTVCYGFRTTPVGSLLTKADDCTPDPAEDFLDGLALCTCGVGSLSTGGLDVVTLLRNYAAPSGTGDVSIEVRVADATGANASGTTSINISASAGGSGSGGTGSVGISASAQNPTLCLGEATQITATAIPGTAPFTFAFELQGTALAGESLVPAASSATYTAPSGTATSRNIVVTVTDNALTEATTIVTVDSISPAAACNDGNECTQNSCTLGVCSNPAVTDGTGCTDDGSTCTDDVCTTGACTHPPVADGTSCDDTLHCNGADTCAAGACTDHAGDPCTLPDLCSEAMDACVECLIDANCDDSNVCTDDVCSLGVCFNTSNLATCDDGLFCTATDTCSGGNCIGVGNPCGGQACDEGTDACVDCLNAADCNDFNVCTDDACTVGACQYTNNTDPCDDGLFCTGADTCAGGTCSNNAGDPCTLPDLCSEGLDACVECLINSDCDDANVCTDDVCSLGVCFNTSNLAACDDGLFCNGADTCSGNTCSVHAGAPCGAQLCDEAGDACVDCLADGDCDDGNGCTNNTCAAGVCQTANNTAACDDGLFCNGADTCSGGSCSTNAGDPCTLPDLCSEGLDACVECLVDTDCNDANVCTTDQCSGGTCFNTPNLLACDDGLFCNGTDTCGGGTCSVHTGTPCGAQACDEGGDTCVDCLVDGDCDDANGCTDDSCAAGVCQFVSNADACDDGLFCNGADVCSGGACTHAGDPCTVPDLCNEASDSCVTCLVNGDCDDGNVCTTDFCSGGACFNFNNAVSCDDGLFCNGADVCSGGSCTHAGDPCSAGAECSDTCNETADNCLSLAGTTCGDPTATDCNAADTCDGAGACQDNLAGAGAACGDLGATECDDPDSCDGAGACLDNFVAVGTACGDPSITDCTNPDTCDGAGTCEVNDEPDGTACNDCPATPACDVCAAGVCQDL